MKQLIFSFKEKYIKATLVEKSGNDYEVLAGGSIEVASGSIEAGLVKKPDEVKEKLQNLIGGVSAAKSHQIVILLSEEASFLKILRENKGDPLENPSIQEEIPYPIKSSFTTLRLLKSKNIQLAAAPGEVISSYQKLFKDLGLEVNSIIPEPVVFLQHLENIHKPILVISPEEGSVLFAVIYESGIFFSTTKYFKDGVFDGDKLIEWVKEISEQEIKTLSPDLDFEVVMYGENENEIFEQLQKDNKLAKVLQVNFKKVNPQIGDVSKYKKMVLAADLKKQTPGFYIKGFKPTKAIRPTILPKINLGLIGVLLLGIIMIASILWFVPKLLDRYSSTNNQEPPQIATTPVASQSASVTPPIQEERPKEATKPAEKEEKKKEEPKPTPQKSSLKVEVLNGSGVAGTAGQAEELLKVKGYNVVSVGNAANYNYTTTEIRLKKSKEDFFPLLTKDLSSSYTITKGASLKESSSFDAQVIIGK